MVDFTILPLYMATASTLCTEEHPVWIDEVIEADEVRILSRMVTHLITNLTVDRIITTLIML